MCSAREVHLVNSELPPLFHQSCCHARQMSAPHTLLYFACVPSRAPIAPTVSCPILAIHPTAVGASRSLVHATMHPFPFCHCGLATVASPPTLPAPIAATPDTAADEAAACAAGTDAACNFVLPPFLSVFFSVPIHAGAAAVVVATSSSIACGGGVVAVGEQIPLSICSSPSWHRGWL